MAHVLRVEIWVRAANALDPPECHELGIRSAHQTVADHVNAVFKVPLRYVGLCTQLLAQAGKQLGKFSIVMVLPERLEAVELMCAFEVC
jgi:hypothetical protein